MTRREQKERTRVKILLAAKVLFEAHGFEKATMREIAKAAGMSTGAVFANWRDKAHLYREVYGHDPITPEQGKRFHDALLAVGIEPSRLLTA